MRVKLMAVFALLVFGLSAAPAFAGPSQTSCADIVDASGSYRGAIPSFTLTLTLVTKTPACTAATYTLYVVDDPPTSPPTPSQLLARASRGGDGVSTSVTFSSVAVTDDDPTVCIWVTSAIRTRTIDRAPDSGCLALTAPTNFPSEGSFH